MDFEQIQHEIGEWAHANFGDGNARHSLLGMMEEAGELCHAVLKNAQGIRGTKEEHHAAMCDAVGDIVVYLVDFRRRLGIGKLIHMLPARPESGPVDDTQYAELAASRIYQRISGIAERFCPFFSDCLHAGALSRLDHYTPQLLVNLDEFCWSIGVTLEECIEHTWTKVVSKRDWKANPLTGQAGV